MHLPVVDPSSAVPPFEQLRTQLLAAVTRGELAPGERLPTVRRLAAALDLAPGTVARAYHELEAVGVIETRGRAGSFVAWDHDPARRRAQRAAAAFVEQAMSLGVTPDDAVSLVRAALRAVSPTRPGDPA